MGRPRSGPARGSKPAKSRPALVVQADAFNASRLNTSLAAVITSNTALAGVAGNVFLPADASGLDCDSVVNVTAVVTLDEAELGAPVGHLPHHLMVAVDDGLRLVLDLSQVAQRTGSRPGPRAGPG